MTTSEAPKARFVSDRPVAYAAYALALLLVIAILVNGRAHREFGATLGVSDFRAFYCGAKVVLERENPYLTEPILRCQGALAGVPAGSPASLDPAPLPGYVFVLFAPLALLPYDAGALTFMALSILAAFVAAQLLASVARVPFVVALASALVIEGFRTIGYGQLGPLVVLSLCAGAYLLEREKPELAGVVVAFSMIEPHVGLPAALSVFAFVPRARLTLAGMGTLFAGCALAAVGPANVVSYFTQTLPVHQLSEIGEPIQYSLTFVLHAFGVPDATALRLGSLDYAAMVVFGVVLAQRIARAFASPTPIVLFPVVPAMFGGPFVHLFEIAAVVPFAVWYLGRSSKYRLVAAAAVLLLALEWPTRHFLRMNVAEAGIIAAIVWYVAAGRPVWLRAGLAVAMIALYFATPAALAAVDSRPFSATAGIPSAELAPYDAALASKQIAIERSARPTWRDVSPRTMAEKVPTWLGIMLTIGLGVGLVALSSHPTNTLESPRVQRASGTGARPVR